MQNLIIATIFFLIGAMLGAQRGLNKIKDEAYRMASQMYDTAITSFVDTDQIKNSEISQQAQTYFKEQGDKIKQEATDYVKDLIKKEINAKFEAEKNN